MADHDDDNDGLIFKLIICLIAAASAAVVVTIYHCITARYMRPPSRQWSPPAEVQQQEISVSMENSVAELLPSRKYEGVMGVACAICLCEFEEGEELRTLPECSHSFHVACIDMWLYSHWSCPMCRSVVEVLGPSSSPPLPTNTTPIQTL